LRGTDRSQAKIKRDVKRKVKHTNVLRWDSQGEVRMNKKKEPAPKRTQWGVITEIGRKSSASGRI